MAHVYKGWTKLILCFLNTLQTRFGSDRHTSLFNPQTLQVLSLGNVFQRLFFFMIKSQLGELGIFGLNIQSPYKGQNEVYIVFTVFRDWEIVLSTFFKAFPFVIFRVGIFHFTGYPACRIIRPAVAGYPAFSLKNIRHPAK